MFSKNNLCSWKYIYNNVLVYIFFTVVYKCTLFMHSLWPFKDFLYIEDNSWLTIFSLPHKQNYSSPMQQMLDNCTLNRKGPILALLRLCHWQDLDRLDSVLEDNVSPKSLLTSRGLRFFKPPQGHGHYIVLINKHIRDNLNVSSMEKKRVFY